MALATRSSHRVKPNRMQTLATVRRARREGNRQVPTRVARFPPEVIRAEARAEVVAARSRAAATEAALRFPASARLARHTVL